MLALVAESPSKASLREVPDPEPGPGEVVARVTVALTCGTDLKMLRRGHPLVPFPAVLGHEFAGVVERAGAGTPFSPGDRVTATTSGPCGECVDCRRGRANLCPSAFAPPMWGAFAERVLVPRHVVGAGLRLIPEGLAPEAAALLDPLASVVRGISRLPREDGATWLVFGSGPIALLFAALCRRAGAERVLVAGRRAEKLRAFVPFGAETVDVTRQNVAEAVAAATAGRGADVVVEATGDPAVACTCVSLAARGGTVLLFSGSGRDATIPLVHARVHYDEVSVVGSFHYTPEQATKALRLLEEGAIPVASIVTSKRPLAQWAEAFGSMTAGADMKVALVP